MEAILDTVFDGDATPLAFECPRCGQVARDEFETLDTMTSTDWKCGRCARPFNVLLWECPGCAAENMAVAMDASEQVDPKDLTCPRCGRWCIDHEDEDEELLRGPS